jgi:hypothetical protein
MTRPALTRAAARRLSIATVELTDGTRRRGVISSTGPDTFTLTAHPDRWRIPYTEVAAVVESTPRITVNLPTFSKLMRGSL